MKALIENINQILAEWDPIGVGEIIATDEYSGYIPIILRSVNDKNILISCLANILANKIGLDYDTSNKSHIKDLQQVCEKIIQVYNKYKAPQNIEVSPKI
jgi:hypothetical protein